MSAYHTALERYRNERNAHHLDEVLFQHLLYLFPAILVAQADGHVDTTEVMHLNKLVLYITENQSGFNEDQLKAEIRYLMWNAQIWRTAFLNALKELLAETHKGREVIDLMISTASSSTGSLINNILLSTLNPSNDSVKTSLNFDPAAEFISDVEKNEIVNVAKYLGLFNDKSILDTINLIMNLPKS